MKNNSNKKRVAVIEIRYVSDTVRAGMLVFGGHKDLLGTSVTAYSGNGYSLYLKEKTKGSDIYFGGFVSSPMLDKENGYPPSDFYIYLNRYEGTNEEIVYTVSLSEYDSDKQEFGNKVASGVLYKSQIPGMCSGFLFEVTDEDRSNTKSKSKASGVSAGGTVIHW